MSKINATKSAIEFAKHNGFDISKVNGTGSGGRVLLDDAGYYFDAILEAEELEAEAIDPQTAVLVRLVDAQTAVLDGKSILRNESHRVTYRAYTRARDNHPNKFAVKFGDMTEYHILG